MDSFDAMAVPEFEELSINPMGPTLWDHLVGCLHGAAEVDFVRTAIGESAIAPNDCAREELKTLLHILSDMRQDATARESQPRLPPKGALAPVNRDLLERQLRDLIVQARATPTLDAIVETPRERMIVEYVANNGRRPSSAAGGASARGLMSLRPGSQSGMRSSSTSLDSRPTSASVGGGSSSAHTDPMQALQPLHRQLRFDAVHSIVPRLRELFAEELRALLADIDFVRGAIDAEITWSRFVEPSTSELKALTTKLSKKEEDDLHASKILALPSKKRSLPALAIEHAAVLSPGGSGAFQR